MKTILLKYLEISNFKGIAQQRIDFGNRVEIYGRNGLGKTSILDAFLWCLFGKDSNGSSSFSLRPLNADGTIKEHLDVSVTCELSINGCDKTFQRKWIEKLDKNGKHRGNEGAYYVDHAPVKESDYRTVISDICREDLFALITSTGAFNRMKDADRRRVLATMAEEFSEIDLADGLPHVYDALSKGRSVESYKAEIKSSLSKAEVELSQFPTRLRENAEMRPVLPDNVGEAPMMLMSFKAELDGLEKKLRGEYDQTAIDAQQRIIDSLAADKLQIKADKKKAIDKKASNLLDEIGKLNRDISTYERELKTAVDNVSVYNKLQARIKTKLDSIIAEFEAVNSNSIELSVDTVCPVCGTPFSEYDIDTKKDELIKAFNADKLAKLDDIDARGREAHKELSDAKESAEMWSNRANGIENTLRDLRGELAKLESDKDNVPDIELVLSADLEYINVSNAYNEALAKLMQLQTPTNDAQVLNTEIEIVKRKIAVLENVLKLADQVERFDQRKKELEEQQKSVGEKVSEYKGILEEIRTFSMRKTDVMEKSIAGKFRFVKFKMFEHNLTNDDVKEVCVCTVDGVPYGSLNTAMRYNADIDIINALSSHYKIVAPVFIDRAESINVIEETAGQRIDLYATKEDETLRIIQVN